MDRPPRMSSIVARARSGMEPRPVSKALRMPARPRIRPPVGKSGPGMICISSASVVSGSAISFSVASITSPGLWVGMLVAMPTAMPPAPFTSRFG